MQTDDVVGGAGEEPGRALAEAQVLGALAYGQLCSVSATFAAVRAAPDVRRADQLVSHGRRELAAFDALRGRVEQLTDLSDALVARQKEAFDAFFAAVPLDAWPRAMAFFAFALPLSADFARSIAPSLGEASGDVLLSALAERDSFEAFAAAEMRAHLEGTDDDEDDEDASRHEELRSLVADLLGRALTGLQTVMASTDALAVLMSDDLADGEPHHDDADRVAKHLAMQTLEGHRRRMHAFGLDDLA